eukprot:TRINITY_DN17565_c0_g1_i1.p1 TRINITY_DN17565_c0_g1~~TRINITY_DN17565_c0_g1_i1.p1  ORF type:complete len:259 (-),score=60.97 TRINITY_DN17565_c0_g1_i1:49-825(-)
MDHIPIIGVNTDISNKDPARPTCSLGLSYVDAIVRAGAIPLAFPPLDVDGPRLKQQLEQLTALVDGFLLIGGPDYRPEDYHERPLPNAQLNLVDARRDRFDNALAAHLLHNTDLPVLAICGGHQLVNIVLGGKLIQNLNTAPQHREGAPGHSVSLAATSRLARVMAGAVPRGDPAVDVLVNVNTSHHQAVDPSHVGAGLRVAAQSDDGVVEAVECDSAERFVIGVQWHPEKLAANNQQHHAIFIDFVAAARNHRSTRG